MNISTVDAPFRKAVLFLLLSMLVLCITSHAQSQAGQTQVGNQVLGEVSLVGKTKAEKTAGVWIDGQYVGYIAELRDDKKVYELPITTGTENQDQVIVKQGLAGSETLVLHPADKLKEGDVVKVKG